MPRPNGVQIVQKNYLMRQYQECTSQRVEAPGGEQKLNSVGTLLMAMLLSQRMINFHAALQQGPKPSSPVPRSTARPSSVPAMPLSVPNALRASDAAFDVRTQLGVEGTSGQYLESCPTDPVWGGKAHALACCVDLGDSQPVHTDDVMNSISAGLRDRHYPFMLVGEKHTVQECAEFKHVITLDEFNGFLRYDLNFKEAPEDSPSAPHTLHVENVEARKLFLLGLAYWHTVIDLPVQPYIERLLRACGLGAVLGKGPGPIADAFQTLSVGFARTLPADATKVRAALKRAGDAVELLKGPRKNTLSVQQITDSTVIIRDSLSLMRELLMVETMKQHILAFVQKEKRLPRVLGTFGGAHIDALVGQLKVVYDEAAKLLPKAKGKKGRHVEL